MNAVTRPFERPIRQARRRLVIARFCETLWRSLFVAWTVAAVAILAAAIWPLPDSRAAQTTAAGLSSEGAISSPWAPAGITWMMVASGLAVLTAAGWTAATAPSRGQAAAELDARYALRERFSSALQLSEHDLQTPMGQALLADASRQAEPLDVRDRFSLRPTGPGWLALLPAALMIAALFVPPRHREPVTPELSPQLVSQAEQVRNAAESLKKRLQQQINRSEAAGLEEAEAFFRKLQREVDQLTSKPNIGPREAMIELNDIKKQMDQRRDQLGGNDQMKSALARLGSTELGPADQFTQAMRQGDFAQAQQMAADLAKKLRSSELSEQDKQMLKQQLEQIRDRLNAAAEKQRAASEQLQRQIDEAKQAGRHEEAARLEQRQQESQAQAAQAAQMQQLAEKLDAAAQAMQGGGQSGESSAADQLEAIADQFGQMQDELQELQELDDALDALAESKSQMNCGSCQGQGCGQCQGGNQPGQKGNRPGQRGALSNSPSHQYGHGSGPGDGDPQDLQASTYDSQVRGQQRAGENRVTGFADGPNRQGASRAEIREVVQEAIADQSDPLENQNLPRAERDHTRAYFDQLRSGNRPE